MKEKYNKSTPSVSYTAAMDLLAVKLAIHSRSIGKNAERAFDDALVHARDAAHARAYSILFGECGRDIALQASEDIAQTVALRLFDGKVRARLLGVLPRLTTAKDRRRFFGAVIRNRIKDVQRSGLRGPRTVSLYDCGDVEPSDKMIALIDRISNNSLWPSQIAEQLDSMGSMLTKVESQWQSTKSAADITDWSPAEELIGKADESDRPSEDRLSKRTRQRRQQEADDIAREWRKRLNGPEADESPSL